jgi:hypothetical protein
MGEAMNRTEVERELREKLAAYTGEGDDSYGSPRILTSLEQLVVDLLPWIMEMREDAATQATIDAGELP